MTWFQPLEVRKRVNKLHVEPPLRRFFLRGWQGSECWSRCTVARVAEFVEQHSRPTAAVFWRPQRRSEWRCQSQSWTFRSSDWDRCRCVNIHVQWCIYTCVHRCLCQYQTISNVWSIVQALTNIPSGSWKSTAYIYFGVICKRLFGSVGIERRHWPIQANRLDERVQQPSHQSDTDIAVEQIWSIHKWAFLTPRTIGFQIK